MIKLCDSVKNGRLANKLLQNIGISVLAKKHNLFPEYHNIIENNLIGLDLFYGDKTVDNDFNSKCFINTVNMSGEEVIEVIKKIDTDNELYDKMRSEPLFENKVTLDPIIKNFYKILK